jgi:hypothetical protein
MREGRGLILLLAIRKKRTGPDIRSSTEKIHQIQITMNHREESKMHQKMMNPEEDGVMRMNQGEDWMTTMNRGEDSRMTMNRGEDSGMTMNRGEDGRTTVNQGEDGRTTMNQGEDGRTTMSQGEDGRMMRNQGKEATLTVQDMIALMLMIGKGDIIHLQTAIMQTQSMMVQTLGPKEWMIATKLEIPLLNTIPALNKALASRQGEKVNMAGTRVLHSIVDGVVSTICRKRRG